MFHSIAEIVPPEFENGQTLLHLNLEFDADIFGPLQCLQYFSSLGILPERYEISRSDDGAGWRVRLSVEKGRNNSLTMRALKRVLGMHFSVRSVITERA